MGKGGSSLHVTHLNMYRDNARVERTYGARRVLEWNGASRSVSDSLFTSRVSLSLSLPALALAISSLSSRRRAARVLFPND